MPSLYTTRVHARSLSIDTTGVAETIRAFFAVVGDALGAPFRWVASIVGSVVHAVVVVLETVFKALATPFKHIGEMLKTVGRALATGGRSVWTTLEASKIGSAIAESAQWLWRALLLAAHNAYGVLFGPDAFTTHHPYLAGVTLLAIFEPNLINLLLLPFRIGLLIMVELVLCLLGFARAGVRADSFASQTHSSYGAAPPGTAFRAAQSAGATGLVGGGLSMFSPTLLVLGHPVATSVMWTIRLSCGAASVYILGRELGVWA